MQNLRIINIQVNDSSNIDVFFTENLTSNITTSNIFITSDTTDVPSSEVLLVKINANVLNITCQPLTPLAVYFISFISTSLYPFISLNGDAKISEDGVSNKYLITGPLASDNVVKNYFLSYFKNNIYDLSNDNAIISKYINILSTTLSRALYDIRQVKNENYLSFLVTDEQKIRGSGPFDRLNEEGAYDIIRVGRNISTSNSKITFSIDSFPNYPITLQKQDNIEFLKISSNGNDAGYFNINNLTFNLTNYPVTKVKSIIFTLTTANPIYIYDISKLRYQIKNSKYDQNFAFNYELLSDNQIKISDKILEDPNFSINQIFKIEIQYEYKDLGRVIDANSVNVTTIKTSIREVLPPIINIFNLNNAPVVDTNGTISTIGGVIFTNPNNLQTLHPAFLTELPFRLNGLPFSPGQYSIDYATGTVYVYGSSINNDGTGSYPPLVTYNYLLTYKQDQDYIYDSDLLDLVSLPLGNLISSQGNINFNYEEVLVLGTDYNVGLHQEVLSERINNNLLAANVIKTQFAPITNVFRIYNETSGEIYTLDRWNNNKIYFRYTNPPALNKIVGERATFQTITNELLFVNTTIKNINSINVFKILLKNNSIISSTEDTLGSSFNTSITSLNENIFIYEKWFDRQLNELNINKLQNIGEYCVDYINGIIYCAVSNSQNFNIGTISYKINNIVPQFPHLISVDDIYYQITTLEQKNKKFSYMSFDDGIIIPEIPNYSDELSLNNNTNFIYQINNNNNIGTFIDSFFVPGVTNQIKFVRSIFEYSDLLNNKFPLNFAINSISNGFTIKVNSISGQISENVQFDGINHYVVIDKNISYMSPNISYSFSVNRLSDSASLWNNSGTIIVGSPMKLILSGINTPVTGDLVTITYTFTINNISRIVVDYNKGEYYIDYSYIADEIIISYEYGDNVIDFRKNKNLPANTQYFVTYKAGALRDALLKNFGTLINIPELSNFDIDFDRERYRDALMAGLTSFIQGPTLTAIKNIVKTISHIEPEITESVFQNWSLGNSLLNPELIETTGTFQLLPSKFDNGVLIDSQDQTIKFPINSNIRFEEGTFETWISPSWNGLDNDALLTFNITKDGNTVDPSKIFIGAGEYHPNISSNGIFILSKLDNVLGTPHKNKDGIFIYYDNDISGSFQRWYVEVIDGYVSNSSNYQFKIISNGLFYDAKSISIPKPSNMTIFTGTNTINFNIAAMGKQDEGITFISDIEHYILDFGEDKSKNRLSVFKDISGYINFKVYDKEKNIFTISSDVSNWKNGDNHHIAISWKLNSINNRDEMHLFIDGVEVPNIIRYGQKLTPYLHEKFRTVDPEEIIELVNRDIVSSTDLQTSAGSSHVSSLINFSALNIFVGDTIYINEIGFSSYTILNINGQNLILSSPMPQTLTNGRFSINKQQFIVSSNIDVATNIAVSTIHPLILGTDISGNIGSNTITSNTINFSSNNIIPGYLIRIDNSLLAITYTILQVTNNTLLIDNVLAVTIHNNNFKIYSHLENELPGVRALNPAYSISKDSNFNNILTISNNVFSGDLILIRTLGLNYRKIKKSYYVWSNNVENILMTNLAAPISLDEVKVFKTILPSTAIGINNSILTGNVFTCNNLITDQPSISQNGRIINATISGTNVDFSVPINITINGVSNNHTITEIISFNSYTTLNFINAYTSINYINISVKSININRPGCVITMKEKYPITYGINDGYQPAIRFSYAINHGNFLYKSGNNTVTDNNNLFSDLDVGNYLQIMSPSSMTGFYKINQVSFDKKTLFITPTHASATIPLPSFSNGTYQILNVSAYRGGLQNGFFTFEMFNSPGQDYFLNKGFYEFEYFTYAKIKFDPFDSYVYLGSDFYGNNQLNGIINQIKIYSSMLNDTRIGESVPINQLSITKDFNSLKSLTKDQNTLMLINFNKLPFVNISDFYIPLINNKKYFYSLEAVNDNFDSSLSLDKSLVIPNDGILNTKKEGTIEFWINPFFDTANDPNKRFYFDAYGAIIEESISINNVSVKVSNSIGKILNVKLKGGDPNIDYFAGGSVEIDTQNAIQEESLSFTNNSVLVSKPILQVISVKIIGDATNTDYFNNGNISTDKKTIYLAKLLPNNNLPLLITYQSEDNNNHSINTQVIRLNKKLPYQKSNVIINYVPNGLQGDRISIFKDEVGYMNFSINASGKDYVAKAPVYWSKNTWHRIKASYKINNGINIDEMRLFLDGYQYNNLINDGYNISSNITFKDPINELFIGSQYNDEFVAFCLINNFKISNISSPIYAPYGEPIDINYTSNLDMAFPVVKDLFTTYLLNSNNILTINKDFSILKNRETGLFDFSVNVIDSLGIVNSSVKSKEALEKLIKILKPANSRVFIQYT